MIIPGFCFFTYRKNKNPGEPGAEDRAHSVLVPARSANEDFTGNGLMENIGYGLRARVYNFREFSPKGKMFHDFS
uniref:Uncharacterized protein n=1 Tax=Candidatus Kentrum sp. LFY TaxID=2126342 RepID=A0A450W9N8_9GAMM|nr:MAG: hypothetical protein BECKLFY1418C_GA0070996_100427 [Candidatus Kentron sp. LFY]